MSVHDCGLILIFTFIIIMSSGNSVTDSHMWVGCEIYQAVYSINVMYFAALVLILHVCL